MSQFVVPTSREFTLGQDLLSTGTDTSLTLNSSETLTITRGVLKIGTGDGSEWAYFGGLTNNGDGTYTATSVVRGLDKDATTTGDATDANKKDHKSGVLVEIVLHSVDINEYLQNDADNTITGDNTFTGTNTFSGTSKVLTIIQNVTTVERDALTGVVTGAIVYNTTADEFQVYDGATWDTIPDGAVYEFAQEAQKGTVELSTTTDTQNATQYGESGAGVVLRTEDLVKTRAGNSDAYKVVVLNSDGNIDETFLPTEAAKWGGDQSDGELTSGATISGSGYIVKNYSSMTPGNNTISVSGQDVVLHIKCFGDCDLTDTTIDLSGKGGAGGTGGIVDLNTISQVGGPGDNGGDATSTYIRGEGGGGGTGGASGAAGTDASATTTLGADLDLVSPARMIYVVAGAGGGGGGAGWNDDYSSGSADTQLGGSGGNGGGTLILEVRGNLTFLSTTIDVSGEDGDDGQDGFSDTPGEYHAGGGGGGGAGGIALMMYAGTLSGSPTVTTTAGSGGSRGGVLTGRAGGGGAGGASLNNAGTAASTGAGGNGGAGESKLIEVQVFA